MKISCIILAAGKSSRFEGNKLLAKWRGKSLLEHTLEKVRRCGFDKYILVTTDTTLRQCEISLDGIEVVLNDDQDLGISHSIKLGVDCAGSTEGYFFIVGDQPLLSFYTIQQFIEGFERSSKGIGCVGFGVRKGNPTLFGRQYKERLLALHGDQGGKQIIRLFAEDVWVYQVESEEELRDIDTLKDYKHICKCETDEV
ncbi:MAG: nucleotidyltransferase family protein [Cellulosilyticaceae bacterium]